MSNGPVHEIRVLIADDHPVAREGLSSILRSLKGVRVVGEAADGQEACELYDQLSPDVLIVDLQMPRKDGLQVVTELMSSRTPKPQIIVKKGDNSATAFKSVVTDVGQYNWEGDQPLRRRFSRTVIYEMHMGGFTKHPNSGVGPGNRGTYSGLIEKIPYLQDLGVTAVELLPVFQFDQQEAPNGLTNYWGYSPVSFFTPHAGYSSSLDPLHVLDEFRDMVKALHRAGIEVILDVVYNHTAEGNQNGPTLCFKGLANDAYYILEPDKSWYANYTGTGNTLNANEPFVRRLICDSLHYWVNVMHVDGFRFDLASILSRDESGRPLENPPVLWVSFSSLSGPKPRRVAHL